MEETTAYRFSEDAVKQAKQRTLLLLVLFPVPVAVGFIAGPATGSGSTRFCAFLIAVMFIEAVLIISTTITLRKMRELTVTLSGEAIERTGGKFTESIAYRDIRLLEISQNPSGQIIRVKIETAPRQIIYLDGLEQMESISQRLEDHVSDQSLVRRKRQALDWNSPLLLIAVVLGTTIVVLWIRGLGRYSLNAFNAVFSLALAVYFLAFKPITRSRGKRFENFERITGMVLLVISLILILLWIVIIAEGGE